MTGEAGVRTALVAVALVAAGIGPAAAQGVPSQIVSPDPSTAQASATQAFDIPPQPLGTALVRFSEATGIQLFFDATIARGLQSPGVSGSMTRQDALGRLLAGSGLVYRFTNATTVAVERPGTSPGTVQLDPVQVQAFAVPPQAMIDNIPPPYAGGQVATGGQLGLLGNRGVMDTPFNQTSYTAKKAQDQQAQTVRDVLVDDPSVRTTYPDGSAADDTIYIRGFQVSSANYAYGGLYGMLPTFSVMAELAERIEILKGPAAMLNGMPPLTAIGGTVNIVPKRAGSTPLTQLAVDYTSNSQLGVHADVARRFGNDEQFGIRFNGVYRAGQTPVEWTSDNRALANMGLDFRGERVRLSADLGYQYQYIGGALPYLGIAPGVPPPQAPQANRNFGEPWNYSQRKDLFGVIRGEVDLAENVTAYASFGAHDFRQAALSGGARLTMTNIYGNVVSTPYNQSVYQQYFTGEAGLRARVDTGPIGHELAFSAMTFKRENGLGTVNGTPFASNVYSPTITARPNIATPASNKVSTLDQSSLAIADTLSVVDKRIQLTVGARLQQVKAANFNFASGVQTDGYDQSALTPAVALIFKPWQNVSIYGNYIQGLQQGIVVPNNFSNAGEVFPPYKSTQYEAGVKIDWGKLTTTASIFQINQPSVITNVATNSQTLGGEQTNQGLELNFFGEVSEGFRVVGGAMFLNAVLSKTQGGLTNGWIAPLTPGATFNLGSEVDLGFAPGVTLTGRAIYTGTQYIDTTAPRRSLPEWTRFDIGARYTFENPGSKGKPLVARFNVDNVLGSNYWAGGGGATSLILGAPRTFRLSLTADF